MAVSSQPLINIGAAANDGTGDPLRTAFLKVNRLPNTDNTVNPLSGDYAGTYEAKLTAAVADAVLAGKKYCWVTQPYDPSLVTFNTAIRMVREGSSLAADVYDVVAYGATAGGVVDTTAAWTAAIAGAATAAGTVYAPPGTYLVNRVSVTSSNVQFSLVNVTLTRVAAGIFGQAMLDIRGSAGVGDILASTAALASSTITVTSAAAFTIGGYIEIQSRALIGGVGPYLYELNQVTNIVGNILTLRTETRNLYDTAVAAVDVRPVTLLTGIVVTGGRFTGPGGADGDCLRLTYCFQPVVTRVEVTNFGDRGIIFARCLGGTINQCLATAGSDPTLSWGISLESAERVEILACTVYNHSWDGIDLSLGSMYNQITDCRVSECGDVGFIVGHGLHGHNNVLVNCIAEGCGAAGFALGNPTYEGDDDNTLIACRAFACLNNGFNVRQNSLRNRFIGCIAEKNTSHGFAVINSTCLDTNFLECAANFNTSFGLSLAGRNRVIGGRFLGNLSRGISLTSAPDTILQAVHVNGTGSGGHAIAVLGASHRTQVLDVRVENAAAGLAGVFVQASTDVLIRDPVALTNGGYGVRIQESGAGDSARSRWVGGYFSGNVTAPFLTNQTIFPTPRTISQVSADRGDASVTLQVDIDVPVQRFATVLTANRTVTLATTDAFNGATFRVVRTGLGAFTLDVGGLKTIPSATAAFVDVEYDGAAWRLTGYGTL